MSTTHKEWMKECIDNCRLNGEIVTSGAAEVLIEKFAQHMDESGSGGMTWVVVTGADNKIYLGHAGDTSHHLTASEFIALYDKGPITQDEGNHKYMCVGYAINDTSSIVAFRTQSGVTETTVTFAKE